MTTSHKKITRIIVTLVLLLAVAGGLAYFAKKHQSDSTTSEVKIVSTVFPGYDFARSVVGDNASLTLLVHPGSETHSYEPSPQDIVAVQQCDLFIYVGGESESWVDKVIINLDTSKTKVIRMMDYVDVVEEEIVDGMESDEHTDAIDYEHDHDDHDHNHHHDDEEAVEYDEHVWTSPKNAIKLVQAIRDQLVVLNADKADLYRSNAASYIASLEHLDQDIRTHVAQAKRKELIFGDRFPLRYFVEEYDLDYYAAFPGCSSQTEASAATIAFLTQKIKQDNIPYIFKIELSNNRIAETLAAETGAEVLEFHALHNLSKEDFDAGKTYLEIMRQNLDNLDKALN